MIARGRRGTDTCLNPSTGETRRQTANGTVYGESALAEQACLVIEGIALGLSLPTPVVAPGDRFAISAGWGQFEGSHALGFGAAVRLSETMTMNAAVGFGLERNTIGSTVGLNVRW